MKTKISLSIIGWFFTMFFTNAIAQTVKVEQVPNNTEDKQIIIKKISPADEKETQEIIIRKNGSKESKITLDIKGSTLLINGKPMAEFKEDGITINNRKVIIKDGNKLTIDFDGDMLNGLDNEENIKSVTIDKLGLEKKIEKRIFENMDSPMQQYFEFNDDEINFSNNESSSKTFLGVTTENDAAGEKVISIEKQSPADKAGLQKGDIIYKIDKEKIARYSDLTKAITAKKEGDKTTVYFLRDGKKKEIEATLGIKKNMITINKVYSYKMPNGKMRSLKVPRTPSMQWPNNLEMNDDFNFDNNMPLLNMRKPKLGLKIQDTEEGKGVKILDVSTDSPAAKAGILKDDIVIEIEGKKITNTDEAREELHNNAEKKSYTIKVKRGTEEKECTIKIPVKLKTANL